MVMTSAQRRAMFAKQRQKSEKQLQNLVNGGKISHHDWVTQKAKIRKRI